VRRLLALLIPRCVREGGSRRGLLGQRQTGRLPRTPPSPVSPGRRLLPKRGGGVPSRTAARRAEGCSPLTRPRASPRTSAASPWSERAASRRCAEASPRTGAPRHLSGSRRRGARPNLLLARRAARLRRLPRPRAGPPRRARRCLARDAPRPTRPAAARRCCRRSRRGRAARALEVGAAAGLCQLPDRYGYDYRAQPRRRE
jgi:hypothetical protein